MSQAAEDAYLLKQRGVSRDLGAFVVAARFSRDGQIVGFALGDGTVRLVKLADLSAWLSVTVHDGAILDMAVDVAGDGFVTGGDDGALRRVSAAGAASDLASFGAMKWVEHVATFPLDRGRGLITASAGKAVKLFNE